MQTSEYLFPNRLTRRDFVKMSATAAAGAGLATFGAPQLQGADKPEGTVRLGSGTNTYEPVEGWGQLPPGMKYGFGCGIVVDSKDRVYVTSRSTNPAVA